MQITLFLIFKGKQQNSHQSLPHESGAGGSPAPFFKVLCCRALPNTTLGEGGVL